MFMAAPTARGLQQFLKTAGAGLDFIVPVVVMMMVVVTSFAMPPPRFVEDQHPEKQQGGQQQQGTQHDEEIKPGWRESLWSERNAVVHHPPPVSVVVPSPRFMSSRCIR